MPVKRIKAISAISFSMSQFAKKVPVKSIKIVQLSITTSANKCDEVLILSHVPFSKQMEVFASNKLHIATL